jgi:putative aminopeptidase FrvX
MDWLELLPKGLIESHGVPGYESPIRAVVRKNMQPLGSLSQDKTRSVACEKKGSAEARRVMLVGQMDEINFMRRQDNKDTLK